VVRINVSQQSQEAILAVHNDGSVLSQEQQIAIFEPFYRSPEAQVSATPGWGLGLAISKEIVLQHQGRLWVESSEKTGTTFFVGLDLDCPVT
ncbi:MAG: ATP-binding protein, partial [Ktedonobacteraceae bacterium]